MRGWHSFAVSLLLAAGVTAQDSTPTSDLGADGTLTTDTSGLPTDVPPSEPSTTDDDPNVNSTDSGGLSVQTGLAANNLPGFCPPGFGVDPNPNNGGGDCRCYGESLGPVPNWAGGANCGCQFGPSQCGCFDPTWGWLYGLVGEGTSPAAATAPGDPDTQPTDGVSPGGFGGGFPGGGFPGGGGGGGFPGQCTVTVTQTPGGGGSPKTCGFGDRFCTVTVTVTTSFGGGGGPGQSFTRTETFTQSGQTLTRTTTVVGPPGQTFPSTTNFPGSTSRFTTGTFFPSSTPSTFRGTGTGFSPSTNRGTGFTTTPTRVTVNAAPHQTGAMAFGAMLGGAAIMMNL